MFLRITSVFIISLLFISCGSSAVYQLPEVQQEELTFKIYEEDPSDVFEQVSSILSEHGSNMLMDEDWEVESSNKQARTIETGWGETGSSGSVSGGRIMGSNSDGSGKSDERFKLNVEISEEGPGSRVFLRLEKQVKMTGNPETEGEWRAFDVNEQTANNHLQPLFEKLKEQGLTES